MSEAGLSVAEVGKEIEHHLKHSSHPMSRHDRIVTIIEAVLLATVALLAAWSGFAAAKWSTESRLQIAEGSASRVEANRAFDEAAENKETDYLAFNAWFAAAMLENEQAMQFAEARASVPSSTSRSRPGSPPTRSPTPTLPRAPRSCPSTCNPSSLTPPSSTSAPRSSRRMAQNRPRRLTATCAPRSSLRPCSSSSASADTSRCTPRATA